MPRTRTAKSIRLSRLVTVIGLLIVGLVIAFLYYVRIVRTAQHRLDVAMANALDNDETGKALELLREGASPNARITLHKDAPSSLWEQIRDTFHPPDAYATVLMIACSRGMKDFARQLLDQGADVNARTRYGDTALHSACTQTDITVVRWLLDKHSDVNARDKEGMTPLFIAVGCRHTAEARLLLEHGADPLARDNDGQSAAYYAWRSSLKPEPEMVKLLKQYSVPP